MTINFQFAARPLVAGIAVVTCLGLTPAACGRQAGPSEDGGALAQGAVAAFAVVPSGVSFKKQNAERVAAPHNDLKDGFEHGISSPELATVAVGGKNYVYSIFRVAEDASAVLRMARVAAEGFSYSDKASGLDRVTPLDSWQWMTKDQFSKTPLEGRSGVPSGHPVAIGGSLLITYAYKDGEYPPHAELFDPGALHQIWDVELTDASRVSNYQGPKYGRNTSLTRVTAGQPSEENGYFNGREGRVVFAYSCDRATDCIDVDGAPFHNEPGYFVQEVTLETHSDQAQSIAFGPRVRLLVDEVGAHDPPAQGLLFHKQNFMVSNLANDTMFFSINYNKVDAKTLKIRPPDRDYPESASFFQVAELSKVLDAAAAGSQVDLSTTAPKESTWTQDINADTPWDQGAIWSQNAYVDPYRNDSVFVMYEAWGADYMQPAKGRNAYYSGNILLWENTPGESCDSVCAARAAPGGSCFSASVIDRTDGLQGVELPHAEDLSKLGINRAVFVCSDLGTRVGTPQNPKIYPDDFTRTAVSVPAGGLAYQDLAATCEGAGNGFVWAEREGYLLLPGARLAAGPDVIVHCSTEYPTDRFRAPVIVHDRQTSCDETCDALGPGPLSIGFRPYAVEARVTPPGGGHGMLDGVNLHPDFELAMQTVWPQTKADYDPKSKDELICVCGPGRNLTDTMSERTGSLSSAR